MPTRSGLPVRSRPWRGWLRAHRCGRRCARIALAHQQEAGNVSRTARRLRVSRNTIYRAIRAE
ncbi:MAG: hypothetical protein M3Y41_05990 [Pseudomonadota bacterium]|nr:hypothetical protein [Pseudomonadota bacterium]